MKRRGARGPAAAMRASNSAMDVGNCSCSSGAVVAVAVAVEASAGKVLIPQTTATKVERRMEKRRKDGSGSV